MTTRYSSAALRDLINAALTEDEFTALAFDYFRPVYEQFAAGQTLRQRVQLLIEHAERRGQTARLAALIQEINPARYREFADRLLASDGEADDAAQQGKYSIYIDSAQGVVIGDRAQVTQVFRDSPAAPPAARGLAAQRHLQQQLVEWQNRYETLSKRIAALDKDLGRTLDSETQVVLEARRQELAAEREQAAEEIAQIEKQLSS